MAKAEFDRATAEEKQAVARVGEIRATIERKQIRAPFTGLLGIRQVNLGQYLQGGDPVVPLQALDPIYVNFSVPQQHARELKAGGEVRVTSRASAGAAFTGRITAVDSIVDEATRNVQVAGHLPNPERPPAPGHVRGGGGGAGSKERGGDLARVRRSATRPTATRCSWSSDLEGPEGQTYKGVRQQFVKLGASRGDQVAVLSGAQGRGRKS